MGTVLVKKGQAEPKIGETKLQWIASGKTILNNKGKPVKQYEPYFSLTEHRFDESEAEAPGGDVQQRRRGDEPVHARAEREASPRPARCSAPTWKSLR